MVDKKHNEVSEVAQLRERCKTLEHQLGKAERMLDRCARLYGFQLPQHQEPTT